MVKTSLNIPPGLWKGAKVRAALEGRDMADVMSDALAAYLAPRGTDGMELQMVGVAIAAPRTLRCVVCKGTWKLGPSPDNLPDGWWHCPKGCNVPEPPGEYSFRMISPEEAARMRPLSSSKEAKRGKKS